MRHCVVVNLLLIVFTAFCAPSYAGVTWLSPNLKHKALNGTTHRTNFDELTQQLMANDGPIILPLPLPSGSTALFVFETDNTLASPLREAYPSIRTFHIYPLNQPTQRGRASLSHQGLHAVFVHNGERVYLDPYSASEPHHYRSYYRNKEPRGFEPTARYSPKQFTQARARNITSAQRIEGQILHYRIAIATTGEYTRYHGGRKVDALAAIATLLSRLNFIYLTELGIEFQLVANNDAVIFTDENNDPFSNSTADIDVNSAVLNAALGSSAYDIGHVLSTGGGGIAYLNSVCSSLKGGAVSGRSQPINDAFYVDFVAHEIGHQFGANHSFNGATLSCGSNRVARTAFEPGSGSSIMSYAGICGEQNLQVFADAHFHLASINEIRQFTLGNGGRCAQIENVSNRAPQVNAGNNYTIPANTPFKLQGQSSDAQTLSYDWQQYDLGAPTLSRADMRDNGSGPLFRNFPPTAEPVRYFPRLNDLLAGRSVIGESLPQTNRALNFQLLVRDGLGEIGTDAMQVRVVDTGEPFALSLPDIGSRWLESIQQVQWQVAATNQAPINCSSVNIDLSLDGGENFDIALARNVPNQGCAELSVPAVQSTRARVKLSCADNIFFALNEGEFEIAIVSQSPLPAQSSCPAPIQQEPAPLSASSGGGGMSNWYTLLGLVLLWPLRRRLNKAHL